MQRVHTSMAQNAQAGNSLRCTLEEVALIYSGRGLSLQITEDRLKEAFSAFGEVTEAKIVIDIESGKSKGFAFVRFALNSNAETAINAMNGRELNGRILRVGRANERPRMLGGMGSDSSSSDGRDYVNSRYSDGGQYGS